MRNSLEFATLMQTIVLIVGILFVFFAISACTVTYTTAEIKKSINEKLPKTVDIKVADVVVSEIKYVKVDEESQRMSFSFHCRVVNKIKDFDCKNFVVSARPILQNDTIYMSEIKAENIDCLVNLTGLTNAVKDYFLTKIDVVDLSGLRKVLAKDIYLKQEAVVVKVGMF